MILFAPLQGYTEAFYRSAHAKIIGGIDEYYTPFLRLEKKELRKRDLRDAEPERNRNVPVVPQILTRDAEETRILAGYLRSLGYTRIDFNFGCPFPKVTDRGYGAAILESPENIAAVLSVVKEFPDVAFSVKMRLPTLDLLPLLHSVPLKHIVLHPRFSCQQYNGAPDRAAYWRFAERCTHKVICNGDFLSANDAEAFPDVMIGRGLLANPLLSLEIGKIEVGNRMRRLREFHAELVRGCAELEQPLQKLKTVWEYLLPDAEKRMRKKLLKSRTMEEYRDSVENLLTD